MLKALGAGFDPRTADQLIFVYEYMTSLLVRVLLLSMLNEETAKLLFLLNAVSEMMVRNAFFVRHLRKMLWIKTEEKRAAWYQLGAWRVLDANNDIVVEYISSVIVAVMLYTLLGLGIFQFASTEEAASLADIGRLLRLVAIQLVPEIEIGTDIYCIWLETEGGLGQLHLDY